MTFTDRLGFCAHGNAQFDGKWKNQRGSTLTLAVKNGVVSGTVEVEVGGRALGDQLTFNVVYEKFETIVAWVGQLTTENGKDTIDIFTKQ